jgi:predicted ferric reductase
MSVEWLVIRGSGIAAFALLAASTAWGLLVSSKALGRIVKAKPLTWFHESLGIGALVAVLIHIGVLSVHDYLDFTWAEILLPGVSDWRPLPVALGIMALYFMTVVVVTFYIKKWIGQRAWRSIHYLSLGVFVSALAHGITAGTDTKTPMMIGLYIGSVLVVSVLVGYRLSNVRDQRRAGTIPRSPTPGSPAPGSVPPGPATPGSARPPVSDLVERSLSRDPTHP